MQFPRPLVPARLVRRYKRFLADAVLGDGTAVVAHCPNPGSMQGLSVPGAEVWLAPAPGPGRKLAWTWVLERSDGGLVCIDAAFANAVAVEAIAAGRIGPLCGYPGLRREVRYGARSRVDAVLTCDGRPDCYVEVKNVHLKRGPAAEFPDSVTARGARHLAELAAVAASGGRAVMLYIVQRQDCAVFRLAADIDPAYAAAFRAAASAGVEALCFACRVGTDAVEVDRPLPIEL
ncbi:MAG: DNA/RNA nuclease SfsA [Rhodospirillales bacterium]